MVVVEGSHYAKYHLVNLIDSKFYCDCFHFDITGIICKHVFAVCNATQKTDFTRLNLHEWWFNTNSLNLDSLHFKNWPLPSQIDNDILMDDVPSSDDFDPVKNAKNALTVFKAIPSNFSKVTKKKEDQK